MENALPFKLPEKQTRSFGPLESTPGFCSILTLMLMALVRLMNNNIIVHYAREFILEKFFYIYWGSIVCIKIVFHLDIGLPAVQPSSRLDSGFPPKKKSRFKTRRQNAHVGIAHPS